MKAIILSDYGDDKLKEVFTDDAMARFSARLTLKDKFIRSEDALQHPADYHDTDILLTTWGVPCLTEPQIAAAFPNLKAIFHCAGTIQHFAPPYFARDVRIFSAWKANAVPVAQSTVGQILLANKGTFSAYRMRHMNKFDYFTTNDFCANYSGNYHPRVGLLGLGTIGRKVVEMLKPFEAEILAYDPFLSEEDAEALGVQKTDLDTIFSSCPTVSNHLANKPEIEGLLDERLFRMLPPYSTFINTGRGAQVNEADMAKVWAERPDLVALIDVTWPEPPAHDSPLHTLENIFLSPHIAGGTRNEFPRMIDYMIEALDQYQANQPCEHEMTQQMLAHMA